MSVYQIYYENRAKMMRPVLSAEEYRSLRDSGKQKQIVNFVRNGHPEQKQYLLQMNYSCLPAATTDCPPGCGPLKGSTTPSDSVGMDVDLHRSDYASDEDYQNALDAIPEKVMQKKDVLGLLMLEKSATKGYHLVFRRHPELTQEENLRWASDLLGVEFDKGAKDITRVFFTTTADPEDLIFLSDELFGMTTDNSLQTTDSTTSQDNDIVCHPEERSDVRNEVRRGSEARQAIFPREKGNEGAFGTSTDNSQQTTDCHAGDSTTSQKRFFADAQNDKEGCALNDNDGEAPSVDAAHRFEPSPRHSSCEHDSALGSGSNCPLSVVNRDDNLDYLGIPYSQIISKWWELYNDGKEPVKSNRDVLTFELAVNLRHICGFDRETMDKVIPCYDGFSHEQKMKCIDSALGEKRTQMPKRLRDVLVELKKDNIKDDNIFRALEEAEEEDDMYYYRNFPKGAMPQGISDSIKSSGPKMIMPVLATCCPAVGALATAVKVMVHGKECPLSISSFVVGDSASNKGDMDEIMDAWMVEESQKNDIYFAQEEEYNEKKRDAKNSEAQPKELHLPVRFLPMTATVPQLTQRLAHIDGTHGISYTPEADTVVQFWRSEMMHFSTMVRLSYDGSRYDREAKSADATTVHIKKLLWNVVMCGTPDALYRVVNNYTDGLLSRLVIAHTPDNTYSPLSDKTYKMTDRLKDRIFQVAHLLPLMQGTLDLPRLEQRSREWVERVRKEALLDDDRVRARARLRDHGTAVRMTVCLMLCAVAEKLIKEHGLTGAEKLLKMRPSLTAEMAVKMQTPSMLDAYELIADSLIDNDMLYFRDKLENATQNKAQDRRRRGRNDHVFGRLPDRFTVEQAYSAKGGGCSMNSIRQMLKNWRKQGLIQVEDESHYRKISHEP